MSRVIKISITLIALLLCGRITLRAQQFTPFPESYNARALIYYEAPSEFSSRTTVVVTGAYDYSNTTIAVPLESKASGAAWEVAAVPRHYEQLPEFRHKNFVGYLFSDTLHYYDKMDGVDDASGNAPASDSIKNAQGIIDMIPAADSLLYALVNNKTNNYIARKKGNSAWEILPIVVHEKGHRPWLRNSILWFAASLLCLGAIFFWLFREKGKKVKEIQDGDTVVQDLKLRADRPLDKNQLAEGDMKQAITAIADVIANRNTPLPMTIAINGAWGSGKSSIMNCIRQMLEENKDQRFITTWFNAWHQESESSLLNAFLLKVIRRCEQPFFRRNIWDSFFASLKFRARLATMRFVKQPVYRKILTGFTIVLFTVVLLDLCISLYYRTHEWHAADLHMLGHTIDWKNLFSVTDITKSVITIVLPVVSFFFLQSEKSPTLGAFANIIYKKNFALDAEKKTPDMREKFRTEYWEIMGALGDKTLVVFIDDLDRVGGGKIFEMLEALNFISDVTSKPDDTQQESFRAVFVLGLYVDQVAENLGSYLIESKETMASSNNNPEKLGLQYLEKMIQLNVPVPLSPNDILEPTHDSPKNAS
jgi:hypothetical protein